MIDKNEMACSQKYEEELKTRCAEIAELKHAYELTINDNSKLELQCDKLRKEKSDLDRKISFLEGQIEAYQYCMNCRRQTDFYVGRQTMEIRTYQNKDDLNGAIDGLAKFCHSFCINCEETEKQNDLVFRCNECPFEQEDKKCSVKVFLHKYATKEQIDKSTAMGSL